MWSRLRIQREEGQYAMHKQDSDGKYRCLPGGEAGPRWALQVRRLFGQMGANGAGDVNLSGGGEGFNMAAMMASMAVGGAVGQNIAASHEQYDGAELISRQPPGCPYPLPIPTAAYHVAVNWTGYRGRSQLSTLAQMTANGQLTGDSLVWKNGMAQWEKANSGR